MKEKTPIVTVTCFRDLPMLDLQAQGVFNYLDKSTPVYLIVNEDDTKKWFEVFNEKIRHYYQNHTLNILTKADFSGDWNYWIHSEINPWAVGWETQQVLKLLIANVIKESQYLILDTQNFLIKDWSPSTYDSDKTPARPGNFVMPTEIWQQYCESLNVEVAQPTADTMSMCTPIFFNTSAVQKLIQHAGATSDFALWFKKASRIKSEFILYAIWLEKLGGLTNFHKMHPVSEDWGNPMLRDCNTDEEFLEFYNRIGTHPTHAWVSANHRAWGNMTSQQYERLRVKLAMFKLKPRFNNYRNNYVDLKF